jgi:hypothetical protein
VLHHFDQFSCSFLLNSYPSTAWGCCGRCTQPQCPPTCCLPPTQRGKTLPHQHPPHHVSDTAPVTVLHHFDQFSCSFLLNSYPSFLWGCCGRRTQSQCPPTCCLLPTQRGKTLPHQHHQHRHTMFLTLPPSLCFIVSINSLVVSCLTVAHCPRGAAVVVAPNPSAHKRAAYCPRNAERPSPTNTATPCF